MDLVADVNAGRPSPGPAPHRIVAAWLPWWPTERLALGRPDTPGPAPPPTAPGARTPSSDPTTAGHASAQNHASRQDPAPSRTRPFVTVGESRNRLVVAACNPLAARAGLKPGMALADARAVVPDLVVRPADPAADALALERLARWATRFTPRVMPNGADTIFLDVSGCTRLFGGEEALTASLRAALCDFGLTARLAVADTPGAAWALARHGPDDPGVVPAGAGPSGIGSALARLPVAALRLDPATASELVSFGLDRIGRLSVMAPAQLTRRFGPEPVRRLEQALGIADEPIVSLRPLPRRTAHRAFADPISTAADIRAALDGLLDDLCPALRRAGQGARRLRLTCRRVDGGSSAVTVGTSRPLRRKEPLMALFAEKLEQIRPGFGIDEMVLTADVVEALGEEQTDWLGEVAGHGRGEDSEALADLLDRLGNRLGFGRIKRPVPRQSWLPERAVGQGGMLKPSARPGPSRPQPAAAPSASADSNFPDNQLDDAGWPPGRRRPLRLLTPPEPVYAVDREPDGAPLAFRRRGRLHRLRFAEGPERLECEWWREEAPSRDYYWVEDEAGGRYWLYREAPAETANAAAETGDAAVRTGDATAEPDAATEPNPAAEPDGRPPARWFLHGLFA